MHRDLLLLSRSVVVLFLLVLTVDATAQDYRAHNWYFGNTGHGIRFNRTDNSASLVTNGATTTPGGTAVATDPANGNLLFYTDGQNIYDASHQVMPGSPGGGLGANPNGNQPVAIASVPGQVKQYYVFVNTASGTTGGTVSYWIVDLTLPGNASVSSPPLGEVVTGPTNVALPGQVSEAMITIPDADGENFYLLTHASGTPAIHVTHFTSTPPAGTTTHTVGLIEHASNFSWYDPGTGNGRVAVSPHETQRSVEVLQFNTTNGGLTPATQLSNTAVMTAVTGAAIYDTEWSNSGQYLYVSRNLGAQGDVLQVDVTNALTTPQNILPQSVDRSFGLQMAPDSTIYHLYQQTAGGSFLVGRITNPDTVAAAINYIADPFGTVDFGAMQFSSFSPMDTVLLSVTFEAEDGCTNTPVAFFPTVTPAADSLVWDFGDGNGGFGWSPVHTYEDAGAFPVTVTAFLRGNTASFTGNINITQFDLQLTLVQDTTACACELPVHNGKPRADGEICPDDTSNDMTVTVAAEGGEPMYQWFGPGGILVDQTTETLRPDSAGYYYVIATMGGCSAYAGVNIKEYDSLNQQMNIWHFGAGAGIDFNPLPDSPALGIAGPLNAPEGTSVICDQNGQVILSTDGQTVYKRGPGGTMVDITPSPNPPGLGGDPAATQSALIVPVPGDETLFYIFTTQATDGPTGAHQLKYSLYDIKLNNGEGDFVVFDQVLFSRSTERITSNGNWLIAHEFGNNSFRAYRVSAQGIGNPVVTAIGSDHTTTVLEHGQGYMELGGENRLAVALSTPGISNVVEVFDFVDSTGMVINFRTADLNTPNGQVYGVELFGDKLYVSLTDTDSKIYEFAFDDEGELTLLQERIYPGEMIGAMQIGPDGMVYIARNGSPSLWTFPPVSDISQQTALDPLQEFALFSGTTSTLGLPNFTQIISSPIQEPAFTWSGACLGDSTRFSASGKDSAIDEFTWSILDSNNQAIPISPDDQGGPELAVLFDNPGTYTVSVVISNKCETNYQIFTEQITINPSPPDPGMGLTFCADPLVLDANPDDLPDFTYAWTTGETTETIEITAVTPPATTVSVTVTDAEGCTTTGEFLIADNRPQVDLGPDLTICQNTPFADLDARNPGTTFTWFFQGNPNGNTTQTQPVDTSTPGTFEYEVEVRDPVTTCRVREGVVLTINESPAWNATTIDPPLPCGTATGQITLLIDGPDGSLFSWFVNGPVPESGTDQVPDVPFSTPANLSAGAYTVTVTDQISGCATTRTVPVNDQAFSVTAVQVRTCDPDIVIEINTGVTAPVVYRVIDDATGNIVGVPTNQPSGDFTTFPLPSGSTYVVEVTQASTPPCIASSPPLQLLQGTTLDVSFDNTDICDDNTLTAVASGGSGNYSFDWSDSPAGSVDPDIGPEVTVSPGTWTLIVTATDNGGTMCPGTAATTLTVEPPLTTDFTQSDACAASVILSASPTGNFTYRWYRDGVAIPGGGGQQIVAGVADDQLAYRVEIVSTLSGCVFASPEKTVNVAGVVNVVLTSTTACEGREFTLTATPTPPSVTTFIWTLEGATLPTTTAQHQDNREGRYLVSFTHSTCTVTDDVYIDPLPVTPGLLLDSYVICPDDPRDDAPNKTVTLDAGEGLLSYQWYVNGQPEPGATDRLFVAEDVGTYRVEMMNIFGCESADETDLFEGCDPLITGPNAFRPSGINTEFSLFTFFIADEDFHIFIFNRWGEMVFQSDQRTFTWNGGYNNNPGQPLPPGTYSYVVKFKSVYDNHVRETRGGVVLLR